MAAKVQEPEIVSPKFSFAGWSFAIWFQKNKLWFIKNKETLKALLSAIFGYLAFTFPENGIIAVLFGAGGAYGSKLILDSLDYFFNDIKEED